MRATIIGAVNFSRITLKLNERYIVVSISSSNISKVKREFNVATVGQLIDRIANIDIASQRIYAISDENGNFVKESEGVPCAYISLLVKEENGEGILW